MTINFETPKVDWASHNAASTADFNRIEGNTLYNYDTISISGNIVFPLVGLSSWDLQKIPITLEAGEKLELKRIQYYITNSSTSGYRLKSGSTTIWQQTDFGSPAQNDIHITLTAVSNTTASPTTTILSIEHFANSIPQDMGIGDSWNFVFVKGLI